MHSLQFWKSWSKFYQAIFGVFSLFVFAAVIFFWTSWSASPAPVISLEHFQQIQQMEVPSHSFQVGLTNLIVPADSYLIFENIFGSKLQPNSWALYFFLGALTISFLFLITLITTLSRYWFLVGMGLVMLFLASLRFEGLEIFGLTNNKSVSIGMVLLFGGAAFYFYAFRKEAALGQRLLIFLTLMILTTLVIYFFSRAASPFLHLAVNGLVAGIILCVIFILMVSHEIVAAFVTITTQNIKSSKSFQHFLILTVVYLINLALMFASKMGFIDWSFFSINSFFVLTVSAILGIWGFRQRGVVYENILPTEQLGLFFYLSMMLTGLSTMSYFAASASDMMMDALDDLIMAAHLGCGIIFFLYVIANFGPMLVKNLPVYKILYKPETMPHFTYRLMSIIAVFAIISTAVSWKTYINLSTASFYHAYGDLYLSQGDEATAEAYYTKSLQFRNQNLHAHYGLASIYGSRYESIKERKEYEKSTEWSPSVPVYLNLGEAYANRGDVLGATLTIEEGMKKFPNSGELQNAAGLSFMRLKLRDSALYFFQQATGSRGTNKIGETNFLGAVTLFNRDYPTDSILSLKNTEQDGVKVNRLALANQRQHSLIFVDKLALDTVLTVYQTTLLCNYLINQKERADTALVSQVMKLAGMASNAGFKERMQVASAHVLYARGEVKRALQTLREVAYRSGDGHYALLLGLWLLEQNNPLAASGYFKSANEKQVPFALYHQAIAETEADSLNQALVSWDSLSRSHNSATGTFASMMKKVLQSKNSEITTLSDEEKYYFCRYKIAMTDSLLFERTVNGIADEKMKAHAIVDRSKKWFALDEPRRASRMLQQVSGQVDKNLRAEMDQLRLMLAAENGDWNFVGEKLNGGLQIPFNQRVYLEALQEEQTGNAKEAALRYRYLLNANNQFEEGIVAASRFIANDTTDRLRNFSLLVDGLVAKPYSVKILKQHVLECIPLNLPEEAQDSLDKLRLLMLPSSFKKFIVAHPDYFGVEKK
jgi:tetratricopeptide (TPR) repeat protein